MANTDTHIDIGIVVRDIDACLPFYRDVVGLKFLADFKAHGGRICGCSLADPAW